jgi:hypothetical protein
MDILLFLVIWILIGISKQCIMMQSDSSLSDVDIDKLLTKAFKGPFS